MTSSSHVLYVDLHIHSRFSRATSPDLTLENIFTTCMRRGISVIGTGDFTHPLWMKELSERLEPTNEGLYKLSQKYESSQRDALPTSVRQHSVHFIPTVEVCTVFESRGRIRQIHFVIVVSSLENARALSQKLSHYGDLAIDGRPTLHMSARELLHTVLATDTTALLIPAHIWTPWFGLLGSKAGFNSLEEAFGTDTHNIHAIETGLDSDPSMNVRIPELASRTFVSHSDAHSCRTIGREATIIQTSPSYKNIVGAIQTNDARIAGTIEYQSLLGKYYFDGHRKCAIRMSPEESRQCDGICPACKRPLTRGVLNRVIQISEGHTPLSVKPSHEIVPLGDIIRSAYGIASLHSRKVKDVYEALVSIFGNEYTLLQDTPIEAVKESGYDAVAQWLQAQRQGELSFTAGYDGLFGTYALQNTTAKEQHSLFELPL